VLPNLIVIGAMKCGTTALHRYLDGHPAIAMSRPKELNFFFGPARGDPQEGEPVDWSRGNWHRGPAWYAAHFDPAAPVRGEASPGYTSPSYPEVAGRMAALVPSARLVYAVRDPVARAVSQYAHHCRDGTESRDLASALLDPGSQYVARGRYFERLAPFLAVGPGERIAVVAQEELRTDPWPTLRAVFAHVDVDDGWSPAVTERRNEAPAPMSRLDEGLRHRLTDAFADDADRLRAFAGRDFPGWSV
jgi:Sulfotransferase family